MDLKVANPNEIQLQNQLKPSVLLSACSEFS